jgi:hypothetical protein
MSSDDCNKYLDININNLLFKNYNIKNLLFSDIDYTFEKQKDGFITRDVNIVKPELSSYSEIMNDCKPNVIFEGDIYYNILLKKKTPGEEADENIDNLIKTINININKILLKMQKIRKQTFLLETSIEDEAFKNIDDSDKNLIIEINKTLAIFFSSEYKDYNL